MSFHVKVAIVWFIGHEICTNQSYRFGKSHRIYNHPLQTSIVNVRQNMISKDERDSSLRNAISELTQDQKNMLHDFLQIHHTNEDTALQFLYARKFDLDRAITLYEEYLSKVELYEFQNVKFVEILPELKTGKLLIPGTRDLKRAGLMIFYAGRHEPDVFPPVATLALTYYLTRILIQDPLNQKHGITIIVDFSDMKWSKLDQDLVRMFVDFFQNGLPVRLKRIILYKPPLWINLFLKLVSLFIKEKLRKRIILADSLDEWIDPNNLPQDLSGQLLYDHGYMITELCEYAKQEGEDVELAFDQDIMRFMIDHAYGESTQDSNEYEPYQKRTKNGLMVIKHLLFGKDNRHLIDANRIMEEFYDSMNTGSSIHTLMKDNTPIDRITENLINNRLDQLRNSNEDQGTISLNQQMLLSALVSDIRTIASDPTSENQISMIPAWEISQQEIKNSIKKLIKREDSSGITKTNYPEALFYPQSIPSRGQKHVIKRNTFTPLRKRTVADSRYLQDIITNQSTEKDSNIRLGM